MFLDPWHLLPHHILFLCLHYLTSLSLSLLPTPRITDTGPRALLNLSQIDRIRAQANSKKDR